MNKEWLDLLVRVADHNNDAILILNDSLEIIFSNQTANSLFFIDESNIVLEQIFSPETVNRIIDQIGISKTENQNKSIKNLELILKSEEKLFLDLFIDSIKVEKKLHKVLLFSLLQEKSNPGDSTRLIVGDQTNFSPKQLEFINQLVKEIKNEFPFTIISLNRLQNFVNSFNEPIYIKDIDNKILVLNSRFADYLGVEISLATGKKLEAFLPAHKIATQKLLDELTISNKQQVVLQVKDKNSNNFGGFRSFIQLPLTDNLNNIRCLVGLIIDDLASKTSFLHIDFELDDLALNLPYPVGVLRLDGVLKQINPQFSYLVGKELLHLKGKNLEEVFSKKVAEIFSSFVNGSEEEISLKLDNDFLIADSNNVFIELMIKKVLSPQKNIINILLILSKPDNFEKSFDDLQNILMYRGKMFDILIEKNPEPIFIYDKENLRFLEVNKAAVNLYGYSRDEFLQMDLTDLYAPEDIQTLLDSFGDELNESRFSKPFRHRKKDGTNVLVEISKTSFTFNEREAHFNIVKDITKDIETDKQNQMLKSIFAETDMMVFTTDASGFIKFANHKVSEKLGFDNREIIQSSFASLVIDEDRAIVNTTIFQSYLKDTVVLETKFKTAKGEEIDAEIFASPIIDFDGETDSFTIVVKTKQNISENENPKEIIKEVIKEVVKEVVVEKQVKVEQKSAIPDANFLSGMFHEILTPINVIIGFSQELITSTENPSEEQKEAAEIINQNRIKMMDTMNSVVEYSDIIQNKSALKIEDITITEIIEKLDSNIKDISGINDIVFSYGKISSSLKFRSDNQKFESFILSLIKVVSRLSKDKKIYFSAFPVDNETFLLGISDQYGNPSEYVSNVLEQVYINGRDPKDFGLPKLTSYLSKTLLSLLDGKFYRSSAISVRPETGFLFPLYLVPKNDVKIFESFQEPVKQEITPTLVEPIVKKLPAEEIPDSTPIVEEKLFDENLPPAEESLIDNKEEEQSAIPDENMVQEAVDNIQTVEEYYAAFANEVVAEEINEAKTKAEAEAKIEAEKSNSKSINVDQTNISEEIKKELEDDIFAEPEPVVSKSVDLTKLNCLYIEDQIDSQILFKVQMKGLNDIKFAASFEDAQLLLLNHQFDFIVMDINLQGEYNGLDALKIIKTMPAFSSIPIIAVTAYVLPGDKEKFIAAGFDDFISKPIFREKMMETLEKIFLS